jgi:hypothetical protein
MAFPVTPGRGQYEQGPVSVDGAWFAVIDGEWRRVPRPDLPVGKTAPSRSYPSRSDQAPVCVDGGWFAVVDGEWRQVPRLTSEARSGTTIPDGSVSVDVAHVLSEQQHP